MGVGGEGQEGSRGLSFLSRGWKEGEEEDGQAGQGCSSWEEGVGLSTQEVIPGSTVLFFISQPPFRFWERERVWLAWVTRISLAGLDQGSASPRGAVLPSRNTAAGGVVLPTISPSSS